ncbi:MAG: tyrosine-type recombinase/integrase [Oscillospiraceae bacterium]|nr:tyrosine-type recombinase/integrase [Oscillospiraceae bacterium]
MANIIKRTSKRGEVSYLIRVFVDQRTNGKQTVKSMTYKPAPELTERQVEKELNQIAVQFEDEIKNGLVAYDGTIKFEDYAARWMETAQIAPKTRERYVQLLKRVNEAFGHIKLKNLQARHLEAFYANLREDGIKEQGCFATPAGLDKMMDKRKISRTALSKTAGIAYATISGVRNGKQVTIATAEKIAAALDVPVQKIFKINKAITGLSDRTVLHHHRVIASILAKAKKEQIIPFNVASEHANAPKVKRQEARYLSDTAAQEMVALLLQEPDIRRKTAILLCLYSGIRRGEFGGLQWKDVDRENKIIHILRATQWQQGKGIVEVPTKNDHSKRVIRLPDLIFDLLAEYRKYWLSQKLKLGNKWEGDDWIFIQENGKPIDHNTLNGWIRKFIAEHDLEHFTPHSLRHTFCSLQIAAGVNIRTIQARTGHSRASTLTDTYSHAFKTADELASEALDDILTPKLGGVRKLSG